MKGTARRQGLRTELSPGHRTVACSPPHASPPRHWGSCTITGEYRRLGARPPRLDAVRSAEGKRAAVMQKGALPHYLPLLCPTSPLPILCFSHVIRSSTMSSHPPQFYASSSFLLLHETS